MYTNKKMWPEQCNKNGFDITIAIFVNSQRFQIFDKKCYHHPMTWGDEGGKEGREGGRKEGKGGGREGGRGEQGSFQ